MRSKKGLILMLVGAVLLSGAVLLTVMNRSEEQTADREAQRVVGILTEEVIPEVSPEDLPVAESPAMQSVEIDGHEYIGRLDIPALGISLPVQKDWNNDNSLMKTAPCRYSGSFLNGDMVIAGHNYRKHFGGLSRLKNGDSVVFTDVDGAVYRYAVLGIETLEGTATEEMVSGDWALTLFTCTYGGRNRVTVRCEDVP